MSAVVQPLDDAQLDEWERTGILHVPHFLTRRELEAVHTAVDDIARRPDGDHDLLQHYEVTGDDNVQICRSEHLIEGYPTIRWLLTDGWMPAMAGALLGEAAVLYKEKINYKLPGGAGFSPHQDAPAYPFIETHVTCMLALDDSTIENGCLEVVDARHAEVLPMDDASCIRADVVQCLDWRPAPVEAGDLLWFHSRAPHRSGTNRTPQSRRAMFCTYSAARHGDLRNAYYDEKLARWADETGPTDTTRVSLIGDFRGRAPSADQLRRLAAADPDEPYGDPPGDDDR